MVGSACLCTASPAAAVASRECTLCIIVYIYTSIYSACTNHTIAIGGRGVGERSLKHTAASIVGLSPSSESMHAFISPVHAGTRHINGAWRLSGECLSVYSLARRGRHLRAMHALISFHAGTNHLLVVWRSWWGVLVCVQPRPPRLSTSGDARIGFRLCQKFT